MPIDLVFDARSPPSIIKGGQASVLEGLLAIDQRVGWVN
jgi:hypothetical protein